MQFIKLFFLPFIALGLVTATIIHDARSPRSQNHVGIKECAILAAAHLLIFGLGFFLASKSKPKDGQYRFGLSPGGWYVGFILTYLTGLIIGIFAV